MDERTKNGADVGGTCYTGRRTEFETVLTDPKYVLAFQMGRLGLTKEFTRTIPILQDNGSYLYEVYLMTEIEWTSFQQVGNTIEAKGTTIPIFSPDKSTGVVM